MKQILKLLAYYLLIVTGLIMVSWLIWSRFIRERTVREIPDHLLTEYRFWILLYISIIYLMVIKNLIKPTKEASIISEIFSEIAEYFYKPLIVLDHLIKYNKYVKLYYYKFIISFAQKFYEIHFYQVHTFIFFMQVFPRIILISFLLIDVFYLHKIEIFYKVILIGLLPFVLRYLKYSLKDIYNYWINELEQKYQFVKIYEVGYEYDKERINNTDAIYHHQEKSIKEYIEIKFDNVYDYLADIVTYEYESFVFIKKEVIDEFCKDKYNKKLPYLRAEEYQYLKKLYYDSIPNVIYLKQYLFNLEIINKDRTIKWPKAIIFSLYVLCWSFVLIISYGHFPIELNGMKYLIINFCRYLMVVDNPFSELYWWSLNENLFTYENVKNLLIRIIKKILAKFL